MKARFKIELPANEFHLHMSQVDNEAKLPVSKGFYLSEI